ncbi:group II intron reverse transcriptase/maturase [[Flexibacter] sp. ATCC 35208]|uniref:group II intron reverse transcriptase/maturase n=1 Tax=[Flexibacter] sp. ATCC 35208 TaxID=1936242 RepID=UPI0009CDBA1F|nr:group II intron reverse transcriptase/maturase [[Flexibacter] sp. ATCC 35208]OMP76707.1 group II intron reverse transcriptase/maturase [[Flexibacter] sp. ATCC 35208]
MNQTKELRYEWEWSTIDWKPVERTVFKLQKRIYRASQKGNQILVRKLQRLLKSSLSAKQLAVKQVSQQNQGRGTAGVDGKTALTPALRQTLVHSIRMESKTKPIRRIWISKTGKSDKRPLGIPTIRERARQTLIKLILEPEWEAKFEPNSYGFRPGRSCHDAIQAIFQGIKFKQAYVLDADIKGCFDNINHQKLLSKLKTSPNQRRLIKCWLKAGIMEDGIILENESGIPQGSPLSPLLANIALDGMERDTKAYLNRQLYQYEKQKSNARGKRPSSHKSAISIIKYADDFLVIHESEKVIAKAKEFISEWLMERGLELKPEKTKLCHTLHKHEGISPGFKFLGFHIRQFSCNDRKKGYKLIIRPAKEAIKKHSDKLKCIVRNHRALDQKGLIWLLNPIIRGWCNYYQYVVSKHTFSYLRNITFRKIWGWACFRHNRRGKKRIKNKYFVRDGGNNWRFCTNDGLLKLAEHTDWNITRFIKVKGEKSPYDGDYIYWASRMGRYAGGFQKTSEILKLQKGKCWKCGLFFKTDSLLTFHYANGNAKDYRRNNLILIHDHCKIQGEVFMTRTNLQRSRMPQKGQVRF